MKAVIAREVDLSDHMVMFVILDDTYKRTFEVHCDWCGGHVVFDDEDDARRDGEWCRHCEKCERCDDDRFVMSDASGGSVDVPCPDCGGTGRQP